MRERSQERIAREALQNERAQLPINHAVLLGNYVRSRDEKARQEVGKAASAHNEPSGILQLLGGLSQQGLEIVKGTCEGDWSQLDSVPEWGSVIRWPHELVKFHPP